MPRVASDVLNVLHQAGVAVIIGPASDNGIEGRQPAVLIHPRPASGSEILELLLHSDFSFGCGSEMDDPTSFRFASLDMKTQKRKSIVDVSDVCLLLRQFQVQFGGEKLLDLLFSGADLGNSGIAHDREVISKANQPKVTQPRLPSLPALG